MGSNERINMRNWRVSKFLDENTQIPEVSDDSELHDGPTLKGSVIFQWISQRSEISDEDVDRWISLYLAERECIEDTYEWSVIPFTLVKSEHMISSKKLDTIAKMNLGHQQFAYDRLVERARLRRAARSDPSDSNAEKISRCPDSILQREVIAIWSERKDLLKIIEDQSQYSKVRKIARHYIGASDS